MLQAKKYFTFGRSSKGLHTYSMALQRFGKITRLVSLCKREPYKPRTLAARGRTRTFLTRHGARWIREIIKCAGTQNVADALTKSLPRPTFHKHREFLKGTAQSFSAFFASADKRAVPAYVTKGGSRSFFKAPPMCIGGSIISITTGRAK